LTPEEKCSGKGKGNTEIARVGPVKERTKKRKNKEGEGHVFIFATGRGLLRVLQPESQKKENEERILIDTRSCIREVFKKGNYGGHENRSRMRWKNWSRASKKKSRRGPSFADGRGGSKEKTRKRKTFTAYAEEGSWRTFVHRRSPIGFVKEGKLFLAFMLRRSRKKSKSNWDY